MKIFRRFTTKPSKQWQIRTISKLIAQNLVTEFGELRNSVHKAIESYGLSLNNLNTLSMRKAISVFTAVLVIASVAAVPAAASADNVGPGHPLYAVDTFMEDLALLLADDDETEELLEDNLEERVDEMDDLLEGEEDLDADELSEGQQYYEDALEAFGETLDKLCGYADEDADAEVSDDAEDTTEEAPECDLDEKTLEKVTHVGEMTLKHLEVLSNVYDKQVEKENDNAASSILGAMESSMNGHKSAVSAVSKNKKDSDSEDGDLVEDFDLPEGDETDESPDFTGDEEDSDEEEKGNRKNELREKVKEQKEKAEKKVKQAKTRGRK